MTVEVMKNDLSGVKVNDKLYDVTCGWGTVKNTRYSITYPLLLVFESTEESFTMNGHKIDDDLFPSLFWDEIKFDYPKKPLPDLAVDTKVIVWNNNTLQNKRHFKEFRNGKCVCFERGQTSFTAKDEETWDNYKIYKEQK